MAITDIIFSRIKVAVVNDYYYVIMFLQSLTESMLMTISLV